MLELTECFFEVFLGVPWLGEGVWLRVYGKILDSCLGLGWLGLVHGQDRVILARDWRIIYIQLMRCTSLIHSLKGMLLISRTALQSVLLDHLIIDPDHVLLTTVTTARLVVQLLLMSTLGAS